jgi:hypothetical protein
MYTIIYHYHSEPIHLESLKKYNQQHQIIDIHTKNNLPKNIVWHNSDRNLRKYIKDYVHLIKNENVLLIEWDMYVNTSIPLMNFDGLYCKYAITPNISPQWQWWSEINKLPEEYRQYASGCPLLGFLGINIEILHKILDPKYDELFEMDMFCELRLATLVKYLRYNIYSFPKNITHNMFTTDKEFAEKQPLLDPNTKGIFHPIKNKI